MRCHLDQFLQLHGRIVIFSSDNCFFGFRTTTPRVTFTSEYEVVSGSMRPHQLIDFKRKIYEVACFPGKRAQFKEYEIKMNKRDVLDLNSHKRR